MEDYIKDRLLYECDSMRAKLNLEITATEHQLDSVKKRLAGLTHDVYVYLAFIFVPLLLIGLMSLFPTRPSVMQIIFQVIYTILLITYILSLPFNIYHFIKACMLLHINKESSDTTITPPPLEGTLKGRPPQQETTYRSEYEKLIYVLTRYYLNVEALDNLEKKINSDNCTLTMAALKIELMKLPIYEDIHPADTFSSSMAKKTKKIAWIIFGTILFLIICYIMFCLVKG